MHVVCIVFISAILSNKIFSKFVTKYDDDDDDELCNHDLMIVFVTPYLHEKNL